MSTQNHIANKIDAKDKKLHEILSQGRYKIDVFQREYRWEYKHMEDLINDLTTSFQKNYRPNHDVNSVDNYNQYYMGPIVLCEDAGSLSIVDGQQRLTSFTLFLIYLNHLQQNLDSDNQADLARFFHTKKAGKRTLVLDVDSRMPVIEHLIKEPTVEFTGNTKDESVINILDRYTDIGILFSEDLRAPEVLPIFIEWLLYKIIMVEVRAYSIENAYTVFETMNDRGLNLSATDMLKGYLLTKIKNDDQAFELNELWKERVAQLRKDISPDGDLDFFKAWLRGKYAVSIRKAAPNSPNQDFEKIGTQFHAWVRDNSPEKTGLNTGEDFYFFVRSDFDYFSQLYLQIYNIKSLPKPNFESFYISRFLTIADSLSYPLYISPISKLDDELTAFEKLRLVDKFIDVYTNVRSISNKTITQSSIRNSMYDLVKAIRDLNYTELKLRLKSELEKSHEPRYSPLPILHEMNNPGYYHYFFARIIYELAEADSIENFADLMRSRKQKSLILFRMFNVDDVENGADVIIPEMQVNSVAGHCLIRRNDFGNIEHLAVESRIKYLLENDYLPEMAGYEFESGKFDVTDFITIREERLRTLVDQIWGDLENRFI